MTQEYLPQAEKLFADLGVQITSAGRRYLGGAIGCLHFVRGYLEGLIQEWLEHLEGFNHLRKPVNPTQRMQLLSTASQQNGATFSW